MLLRNEQSNYLSLSCSGLLKMDDLQKRIAAWSIWRIYTSVFQKKFSHNADLGYLNNKCSEFEAKALSCRIILNSCFKKKTHTLESLSIVASCYEVICRYQQHFPDYNDIWSNIINGVEEFNMGDELVSMMKKLDDNKVKYQNMSRVERLCVAGICNKFLRQELNKKFDENIDTVVKIDTQELTNLVSSCTNLYNYYYENLNTVSDGWLKINLPLVANSKSDVGSKGKTKWRRSISENSVIGIDDDYRDTLEKEQDFLKPKINSSTINDFTFVGTRSGQHRRSFSEMDSTSSRRGSAPISTTSENRKRKKSKASKLKKMSPLMIKFRNEKKKKKKITKEFISSLDAVQEDVILSKGTDTSSSDDFMGPFLDKFKNNLVEDEVLVAHFVDTCWEYLYVHNVWSGVTNFIQDYQSPTTNLVDSPYLRMSYLQAFLDQEMMSQTDFINRLHDICVKMPDLSEQTIAGLKQKHPKLKPTDLSIEDYMSTLRLFILSNVIVELLTYQSEILRHTFSELGDIYTNSLFSCTQEAMEVYSEVYMNLLDHLHRSISKTNTINSPRSPRSFVKKKSKAKILVPIPKITSKRSFYQPTGSVMVTPTDTPKLKRNESFMVVMNHD